MLTLVRPTKSQIADDIEKRLRSMYAAYQVINKEISSIPYLIESGIVMQGKAISKFLDRYQKEKDAETPDMSADRF